MNVFGDEADLMSYDGRLKKGFSNWFNESFAWNVGQLVHGEFFFGKYVEHGVLVKMIAVNNELEYNF